MKYDRTRIKANARSMVGRARPKPWSITFMAWFLALDMTALCFLVYLTSGLFSGPGQLSIPILILALMATLALLLFLLLLYAGYVSYTLHLWRAGSGGPMDLFMGFLLSSQLLPLYGYILLYLLLWCALGLAVLWPILLSLGKLASPLAQTLLTVLAWTGFGAYLLNRTLPYALSLFILLENPDLAPQDTIKKSKRLMIGRKGDLMMLVLSFLPWALLPPAITGLTLLPGLLLQSVSPALPSWLPFLFLGVGLVVALPMLLWLVSYIGVSIAGFYDAAAAPPFQGTAQSGGKRLK